MGWLLLPFAAVTGLAGLDLCRCAISLGFKSQLMPVSCRRSGLRACHLGHGDARRQIGTSSAKKSSVFTKLCKAL
ncbi:hypothetical protein BC629DRAFT_1474514 [Irpex lacteus]|nr:hypothetical protein BC629DRAFT_1555546 [Irpex lacteus]KAI0799869.1 hypothetical protein BC629DRAFT_1499660 [Irpex lacteus]KAI0812637.1 hypothetical protein BC629DRAFT_1474514 [Irpex lacteus]